MRKFVHILNEENEKDLKSSKIGLSRGSELPNNRPTHLEIRFSSAPWPITLFGVIFFVFMLNHPRTIDEK